MDQQEQQPLDRAQEEQELNTVQPSDDPDGAENTGGNRAATTPPTEQVGSDRTPSVTLGTFERQGWWRAAADGGAKAKSKPHH